MLFHLSEEPDITRFDPRPAPKLDRPVVWAVSAARLRNYLLPRDCPRLTFFAGPGTTPADRERFLGDSPAIVAFESAWLDRVRQTRLYCYHLPDASFTCVDECAGYCHSYESVTPVRVEVIDDLLGALASRDVEIRVVPSLWPLHDAVIASTLSYSIIRMRNASPRAESAQLQEPDRPRSEMRGEDARLSFQKMLVRTSASESDAPPDLFVSRHSSPTPQECFMPTFKASDGTKIYFKDWGDGAPVVFSHGWPLCSDAWEAQMFHLASNGYRVIAHDRRGHGRSGQSWDGNEMDTYADDLHRLFKKLDLQNVTMVGHSTGGGEVARYIGRHGSKRVAKAVLVGAVPPIMLRTANNPDGLPMDVFDGFRTAYLVDRAQFFLDIASGPFFGYNRPGAKKSEGVIRNWFNQGMMSGHKNAYDCIKAFSETDFSEDLRSFDIPTLIIHGDDDQIVPIGAAAMISSKLVRNAQLKIYPGGAHGLTDTAKDQLNADLLAFVKS